MDVQSWTYFVRVLAVLSLGGAVVQLLPLWNHYEPWIDEGMDGPTPLTIANGE